VAKRSFDKFGGETIIVWTVVGSRQRESHNSPCAMIKRLE
jgi:hypothetical protein